MKQTECVIRSSMEHAEERFPRIERCPSFYSGLSEGELNSSCDHTPLADLIQKAADKKAEKLQFPYASMFGLHSSFE
jgi:hypothetical protein